MIDITVTLGGVVTPNKIILGNKWENNDEIIAFTIPEEFADYHKYLIGVIKQSGGNHTTVIPITNNTCHVSSNLTYFHGNWNLYLMCREMPLDLSGDIIDIKHKENERVFISDVFIGVVNKNMIDQGDIENIPLDTNLQIVYDDLLTIKDELRYYLDHDAESDLAMSKDIAQNKADIQAFRTKAEEDTMAALESAKEYADGQIDIATNEINNKIPTKISQLEIDVEVGTKDYNDLENKPDIPTKLSDLEIDMEVGGASSWNDLEDKPFGEVIDKVEMVNGVYTSMNVMGVEMIGDIHTLVLQEGEYYEVVFGDKTYNLETIKWETTLSGITDTITPLGNIAIIANMVELMDGEIEWSNIEIVDTGEPFAYYTGLFLVKDPVEDTQIIINRIDKKIKQLDPKFLPDNIGSIQSDWDQNDETSPDYIKNKPFGRTGASIDFSIDLSEVEIIDSMGLNGFQYVMDAPAELFAATGSNVTVVFDETEYTAPVFIDDTMDGALVIGDGLMNLFMGQPQYGFAMAFNAATETDHGMLMCMVIPELIDVPTHTVRVYGDIYEYKTIDRAYLDLGNLVGENVAGREFVVDGEKVTAQFGAEIFNDVSNIATGEWSHAEGFTNIATGSFSHAEGWNNKVLNNAGHAEGYRNVITGWGGHAEGEENTVSGRDAHAEGEKNIASGKSTHVEGRFNVTSGYYSHAEGEGTIANNRSMHVQGTYNDYDRTAYFLEPPYAHSNLDNKPVYIADEYIFDNTTGIITLVDPVIVDMSTVEDKSIYIGKYMMRTDDENGVSDFGVAEIRNISGPKQAWWYVRTPDEVKGKYAHIVGNGTSESRRSNAHTLDWEGNAWFAGDVQATDTDGNSVSLINHSHSWNDLDDRPFYTEVRPVEIINGTYAFTKENGGMYMCENIQSSVNEFITGQNVKAVYDGVEYNTCVSLLSAYGGAISMQYIGNGYLAGFMFGVEEEDTGEPFAMVLLPPNGPIGMVTLEEGSEHSISITLDANVDIQLDRKYIKEIPGLNVEGKVFTIDGEQITAVKGAEIFNDYKYNKATAFYTHAEGEYTAASGRGSHAEGVGTIASGTQGSHAEGRFAEAIGASSHAEGLETKSSGQASHAEGKSSGSPGDYAHAEGWGTVASGQASHAEGRFNVAAGEFQHVQGRFNVSDVDAEGNPLNKYAHIVGNGTDAGNKSNAHTLDWQGNAWFAGKVFVGGTSMDDATELGAGGASSWNDLEDRPFYETVEWVELDNGIYSSMELMGLNAIVCNTSYIGVAEVGQKFRMSFNGQIYDAEIDLVNITAVSSSSDEEFTDPLKCVGNISFINDYIAATGLTIKSTDKELIDNGLPFLFIPSAVIYIVNEPVENIEIITYLGEDTSKQLDPKFVNAYTKEEIDAMFASLINGEEVEF